MAKSTRVKEEALLKALSRLEEEAGDEEEVEKGEMPRSTKEANGGFSGEGGQGEDTSELETGAEENDPTGKSTAAEEGEEEVEEEEEDVKKGKHKSKKSDDSSDDSSDDDSSKSLRSEMEEDDVVSKAIEVSDFLEHFVDQTSDAVDGLRKSVRINSQQQRNFNEMLRKAVVAMGNLIVDIKEQIDAFGEAAPAGPRSHMSKALTARDVQSGVVDRFGGEAPEFSRDQAMSALEAMAISGKIHPAVVTQYETTGSLPREVQAAVEAQLRQH